MGTTHALKRGVVLAVLLLLYVLPLLVFLGKTLPRLDSALSIGSLWSTLRFAVSQAALSAFLALALALPGAYLLSHYRFPARRLLYSLSILPFVLPSIIVVIAMISFYGKSGLINRIFGRNWNLIYNLPGIVLAHVFYNASLGIRVVADGWGRIEPELLESASITGAGPLQRFVRIELPLLAPHLLSALVLVFMYSFMSFGIVLVFGGIRFATFETRLYTQLFDRLDFGGAGLTAAVQLGFSTLLISASAMLARRTAEGSVTRRELKPLRTTGSWARVLAALYIVILLLFIGGPILTLFVRAFSPGGNLSFQAFRELVNPAIAARDILNLMRSSLGGVLMRSVALALGSGTLTFLCALLVTVFLGSKPKPLWEILAQAPLGLSLVTIGLGASFLWKPGLGVVLVQVGFAFPLVYRLVRTTYQRLDPAVTEAARVAGATGTQILRFVQLPLLRSGLGNALAFGVALVLADFTAVMTVGRGRIATFPVAIYRLLGFRSFDLALALSVFYCVLVLLVFLRLDRISSQSN